MTQTKAPNKTKMATPIGIPTPRPIFASEDRADVDGDPVAKGVDATAIDEAD